MKKQYKEYCIIYKDSDEFYTTNEEESEKVFEENKDKVRQYFIKDWIYNTKIKKYEYEEEHVKIIYQNL